MKLKVYSLYDIKAQIYLSPRYYHNQPHAMRMFEIEHRQNQSVVGMYPHDFQIMELGEFDDNFGTFDVHKKPIAVCTIGDIFDLTAKKEQTNGTDNQPETERSTQSHTEAS